MADVLALALLGLPPFVVGYLLGSIPFGLILTRLAGLGDIRAVGSGNIGATNVLRTGKKGLAAATLALDAAKGAAAVLLAMALDAHPTLHWYAWPEAAALGAVVGHIFPVWLRFKGGKGVATALGIFLALAWPVALASAATWLAVAVIFRISSLAAIVALLLGPVFAALWASMPVAVLAILVAVLVILKHHENIRRLVTGQEPRIGK